MKRILRLGFFLPGLFIIATTAPGGASAVPAPALDPPLRALLALPASSAPGVLRSAADGASRPPIPLSLMSAVESGDPPRLEVFLQTEPGRAPGGDGVAAVSMGGGLYAARVTLDGLRRLVDAGALREARLSRPLFPTLDRSTAFLGLGQVRRMDPQTGEFSGATGDGVVVGIVDTGVDWNHPDFRTPGGGSRIAWLWDQEEPFGTPPKPYGFGQEYTGAELDSRAVDSYDRAGHGTHVAGIAAGNGRGSLVPGEGVRFAGLAPKATLVVVRTNFTEFGVAVGARYVFDKAAAMGMPAVLNLSLGNHSGPHLGDTPFERSLMNLVGPGHLIVAAAGNDGARDIHAEVPVPASGAAALRLRFPLHGRDPQTVAYTSIAGWYAPGDRYRFTVIDPDGVDSTRFEWGDVEKRVSFRRADLLASVTSDEGRGTFTLEIADSPGAVRAATGDWTVRIEAAAPESDAQVDFWLVNWRNDTGEYPVFLDDVDHEETVVVPATAPRILAVGAISTRSCWTDSAGGERCYPTPPTEGDVAFFSSIGPTADGRVKPEILAPGYGVVSARSSTISPDSRTPAELAALSTPDGLYWLDQGTSMASPHVAGTVALLLQRFPDLTFDQMVGRITARASTGEDGRTGKSDRILRTGDAVAPAVTLSIADAQVEADGVHVTWYAGRSRGEVRYRVYKGYAPEGPYFAFAGARVGGDNPYTLLDPDPDPGRVQLYRIASVDAAGLEEDLDTLRVPVGGRARFAFRAPDPNPARDAVTLRFYVPPTPAGGAYALRTVDVSGRLVSHEEGSFPPGGADLTRRWDLRGLGGNRVAAGIYFVRLSVRPAAPPGAAPPGAWSAVRRVVVLP